MANFYSYMRISTKEERKKQKFSRQEKALARYAKEHNIEFLMQFKEDKSGKSFEGREKWGQLERIVQKGDTIVFKDITRFTREAENGYRKYMDLMNKGVNLVFIDNPTLSTDYTSQLIETAKSMDFLEKTVNEMLVKVLLAAELTRAEKERLVISQRTKDGMAASSNKAGRKKGQVDKLTDELKTDIKKYLKDRSIKGIDVMKKHNISRNTFRKYCKLIQDEQQAAE